MRDKKITVKQLAEMTGIKQRSLEAFIGRNRGSTEFLGRIARALEVTLDELVDYDSEDDFENVLDGIDDEEDEMDQDDYMLEEEEGIEENAYNSRQSLLEEALILEKIRPDVAEKMRAVAERKFSQFDIDIDHAFANVVMAQKQYAKALLTETAPDITQIKKASTIFIALSHFTKDEDSVNRLVTKLTKREHAWEEGWLARLAVTMTRFKFYDEAKRLLDFIEE